MCVQLIFDIQNMLVKLIPNTMKFNGNRCNLLHFKSLTRCNRGFHFYANLCVFQCADFLANCMKTNETNRVNSVFGKKQLSNLVLKEIAAMKMVLIFYFNCTGFLQVL